MKTILCLTIALLVSGLGFSANAGGIKHHGHKSVAHVGKHHHGHQAKIHRHRNA